MWDYKLTQSWSADEFNVHHSELVLVTEAQTVRNWERQKVLKQRDQEGTDAELWGRKRNRRRKRKQRCSRRRRTSGNRTWNQVIFKEQSAHAGGELRCNYSRSEEEFLKIRRVFAFLDFYQHTHTHTIWHVQQRISCGETNTIKPDRGLDRKHGWIMEQHRKQQWLSQKKSISQSIIRVRVSHSTRQPYLRPCLVLCPAAWHLLYTATWRSWRQLSAAAGTCSAPTGQHKN